MAQESRSRRIPGGVRGREDNRRKAQFHADAAADLISDNAELPGVDWVYVQPKIIAHQTQAAIYTELAKLS